MSALRQLNCSECTANLPALVVFGASVLAFRPASFVAVTVSATSLAGSKPWPESSPCTAKAVALRTSRSLASVAFCASASSSS